MLSLLGFLAVPAALRRFQPGGDAPASSAVPIAPVAALILFGAPLAAFAIACVLHSRTAVLLPRCLAMLAPCGLLATASALHSLLASQRRPWLRPLGVATLTTLAVGVGLMPLLTSPKSNAREAAALLGQQAKPQDGILIAPEQLASSFNWYYRGEQEQYAYPAGSGDRLLVTRFDHFLDRCAAPENLTAAHAWVDGMRAEKRRVWLVTHPPSYYIDAPEDDSRLTPGMLRSREACSARSHQLLLYLTRTFGKPRRIRVPGEDSPRDEPIYLLLFTPPAAAPGRP